jgi:protein MAK11
VLSISIHPSGKAALTVGDDRKLKLWNLTTGSCDFSTTMRNVCISVEWSPSGETFAYIKQNEITVLDSLTLEVVFTLSHEKNVLCFQYLTETLIVSGGEVNLKLFFKSKEQSSLYLGH